MQRVKAMFDDDSAVSPVIGVILMVAITVILAAVIASFVLGLGQGNDPAPQPSLAADTTSQDTLNFSQSGGDTFDSTVTTVDATITYNTSSGTDSAEFDTGLNSGVTNSNVEFVAAPAEMSAGEEFAFVQTNDKEITGWDIEVIYNPSDQDATVIYEDSN